LIRSALRRLLALFAVIFALTSLASLAIGALAHGNLRHALAVGFYIAGAAVLICSFVFGLRGPLRGDWGDEVPSAQGGLMRGGFVPRMVRRTTLDERLDARRSSLALFLLGLALILIGAGFDPSRNAF
jgi:hypothetical protein